MMTEQVVVYCKLPNGLHLRVDEKVITLQGYNHGLRKDEENPYFQMVLLMHMCLWNFGKHGISKTKSWSLSKISLCGLKNH